ncbi:UNVERIFIED_CONTAM: hypothetical protein HDU68_003436 [Siphonaria sp. JEL0065]|nr:hypothetical protein HDU68_003436 [Siphonaria sp. JEL0065]
MSTKPQVRRRVQDPSAPSTKLNTTINPQLTKRASGIADRSSRTARSPNAISSFWGEDPQRQQTGGDSSVASSQASLRSEVEDSRPDIREWYTQNSKTDATGSTKRRTTLFETQQMMPSPGTTYFQLVVQNDRVLLRDWPRQRYSQKWTRDGGLNPGEKVYNTRFFIDGEDKDQLVYIFGMDVYDRAVKEAKKSEAA